MENLQICPTCGAKFPTEQADCPYWGELPKSQGMHDIEFCRWHVHHPGLAGVEHSRYVIEYHDKGPLAKLFNPVRMIGVLMILASLWLSIMSRDHRQLWISLSLMFFVPVGVGLCLYNIWARWLAIAFYSLAIIGTLASSWGPLLQGNFSSVTRLAIPILVLIYLREWNVPPSARATSASISS